MFCCCCARSELLPAGETATAVMGIDFCDSTQAANFQLWWVCFPNAPFLHSSEAANGRIQSCVWSSLPAKFLFLPVLSASFSTHTRKFFVSIQPPVGELMRPVFLTENEFKKEQGEWWNEWKYDEKTTRWASLLFVFLKHISHISFHTNFHCWFVLSCSIFIHWHKEQGNVTKPAGWCAELVLTLSVKHPQYNNCNYYYCKYKPVQYNCNVVNIAVRDVIIVFSTLGEHCEIVSTRHLLVDWKVNGVDYFLKTKLLDKKKKINI